MTKQQDYEEMKEKEDKEEFKECRNCGSYKHIDDSEIENYIGLWFCDLYCVEEWMEEKEEKARAFETIRQELGFKQAVRKEEVVDKVVNTLEELSMRKEGFL